MGNSFVSIILCFFLFLFFYRIPFENIRDTWAFSMQHATWCDAIEKRVTIDTHHTESIVYYMPLMDLEYPIRHPTIRTRPLHGFEWIEKRRRKTKKWNHIQRLWR